MLPDVSCPVPEYSRRRGLAGQIACLVDGRGSMLTLDFSERHLIRARPVSGWCHWEPSGLPWNWMLHFLAIEACSMATV
jgi:hypothetical protein